MNILDDLKRIKEIDRGNILETVEVFPKQCKQAWEDVKKVAIPEDYQNIQNIVINGMGGSGLGGHILFSLFFDELKVPLRVIHSYKIPAYVNEKTLYIISSYSGTTEEPLSTGEEALRRGAKVLGITTGGELKPFLESHRLPHYLINPTYNPSAQPRMGVGYAVLGIIGLLSKCGLIELSDREVEEMISFLEEQKNKFSADQPAANNPIKKLAQELFGKIVVNIGAEFLTGNIHTLTNQLNESSKNFAVFFLIPELNHHLLEGLANPSTLTKDLQFLFIESNLYQPKVQKRFAITKEIVEKNNIKTSFYKTIGKTKFLQVFEILMLSGHLNFYLAMLNQANPIEVPWVDYFKSELKK